MKSATRTGLMLLMLGLASVPAFSDVYKWTDPSGRTVFSDVPPPGVRAQPLSVRVTPAASAPSATSAPAPARRKNASDPLAEEVNALNAKVEAHNAEVRKDNCRRARANLQTLQQTGRIVKPGTTNALASDAERNSMLRQAQQAVQSWCGNP
ncbi:MULTISPECIES: DUF4124 domain-containing protein [Gulbenkiania]|uniref:DUF4124 domain-containing protein n=1 Tax=Gulbenkiania indica TaxID=375574 RepID=A0A0K6GTS6_9NEIS|nr:MULTISPECIES: DUF4124 domain-containing protein [Gulbenkiania]CUA82150.1 Domain of unknown function (DUF4124) [Gulbenkiania indica]